VKTAYFILGMHRSGTSALGGVLNIMGLEFGSELMKADEGNPKGYFENNFVYRLNKKILNEHNSKWDDYSFTMDKISDSNKNIYIKEAKSIIMKEFRYAENFAIKDPRICLLFPIWEQACHDLKINIKIILPFRNPKEVALSLKKRNNFSMEQSLLLWTHYFLSAEYLSRKYKRIFLSFDELLGNTEKVLEQLYAFSGLEKHQSLGLIDNFLDHNIKNNNLLLGNFTKSIPTFLQNLVNLLKESKFDDLDRIDSIRNDFNFSLEMFQHDEIRRELSDREEIRKKLALFEEIKDITIVDEPYYRAKYPDLKRYKGTLSEHYFRYGKKEGRYPNEYCEYYKIDVKQETARDEEIYHNQIKFKALLKSKIDEISVLLLKKEKLETYLNDKKRLNEELVEKIEHKIKEVTAFVLKIENLEKDLQKEKSLNYNLEQKIKNKIEEVTTLVLKKEEQESLLNDKQELASDLEEKIENKREKMNSLLLEKEELEKYLNNKEKLNIELKNKIKQLDKNLKNKSKEIFLLNHNIDQILEDLVSLKENRCWIYTKPIRDLQQSLKGK